VRALYVAMTRARDRLVLLGNRPLNGKGGAREESLLELLRSRRGTPEALADAMARAQAEGRDGASDANGVRWRFPGLQPLEGEPSAPADAEGNADPADLEAELRALDALREAAQRRMQRGFRAPASADAHADEREQRAERERWVPALAAARDVAAAAGTAVHRVLEELSLDGELREELARASDGVGAWIDAQASGGQGEAALASARETLARFGEGPLLARLAAVRGGVIARELPVLLPADPGGEGAVGFVAGSIDLLYRDPDSDELVVVDYKTDRVEGKAALGERAERYRGQARHYRRAVQEALDLAAPPRFELWFLHAGAIVPVD
jgi:ATP-dependent exoDNAse (exonuclease V) beta subunit